MVIRGYENYDSQVQFLFVPASVYDPLGRSTLPEPTTGLWSLAEPPLSESNDQILALVENLSSVIQGKQESLEVLVVALLAGGSVLMEDVPGVGKTTLAKAVSRSIDVSFQRIQCTPDLLPADILGTSIYSPSDGSFRFRAGPIFSNVLLVDEINRASPRTQSALLEAMSEGQATIEGDAHQLPSPFMVLATQNPGDFHGTYPLPEAQLDRFLIDLNLGYPDADTELSILYTQSGSSPLDQLEPVITGEDVMRLQSEVRQVHVDETVGRYVVAIAQRTRQDPRLKLGCSPRGALMLFRAAQASAFMSTRAHVLPDDVQRMAPHVLMHRLMLTAKARYGNETRTQIVRDVLNQVRVPT